VFGDRCSVLGWYSAAFGDRLAQGGVRCSGVKWAVSLSRSQFAVRSAQCALKPQACSVPTPLQEHRKSRPHLRALALHR